MMKTIGIGSKNPAKIKAVKRLCDPLGFEVLAVDVPSGVSDMPMSDEETKQGAIHRAKAVLDVSQADFGVGLEGGVMDIGGSMYLCNWGAFAHRDGHIYTASGARIVLEEALAEGVRSGKELGDVIDAYTSKKDVRKGEGTIGIMTNGRITRDDMFFHVMEALIGQYEYQQKN